MGIIRSKDAIQVIRKMLNCVDDRLVGHGERVAFLLNEVLSAADGYSEQERQMAAIVGLLHDVGAYKTEDIDRMVEFESENIWEHSVYGYLFLKNLSPLGKYASAVLFHHLPYRSYHAVKELNDTHLAGLIDLCDRADMILLHQTPEFCLSYIKKNRGRLFSPVWVDLFMQAEKDKRIVERRQDNSCLDCLDRLMEKVHFTDGVKRELLSMIAYFIDFRSEFMVVHTVNTVSISRILAKRMGLTPSERENIFYGALLHDIGKIACPIGILEKPGRLTPEEMETMRQHVRATGEILGDTLPPEIKRIAVRHHEKLDGSGYPGGLAGEELSMSERIVAVADILSALVRKRSYKEAFGREKTCAILRDMEEKNQIDKTITDYLLKNYDAVLLEAGESARKVETMYQGLREAYLHLLTQVSTLQNTASPFKIS